MTKDKEAVEQEMEESWQDLCAALDSISDAEQEQPGVVEGWSVKDMLGHITFWAEKAGRDLRLVAAGKPDELEVPTGPESVNEWNAREADRRKQLPLSQVREELEAAHQAALQSLRDVPVEVLDVEVKGWTMLVRFAEDTYRHYREHAEHIRAWKREVETTEA